jgi:hypothetical protein
VPAHVNEGGVDAFDEVGSAGHFGRVDDVCYNVGIEDSVPRCWVKSVRTLWACVSQILMFFSAALSNT